MCSTALSTTVQVERVDLRIRFPRVESRERFFSNVTDGALNQQSNERAVTNVTKTLLIILRNKGF